MADMLDIENKSLVTEFYDIVKDQLNEQIIRIKYLGGGSNGKAYSVFLSNGDKIVLKVYRFAGMNETEAQQLKILSENTSVLMPKVLFTYSKEGIALLAMSYIPGKNVLNPIFLLNSKFNKQKFATDVAKGMLEWHSVTESKFGDISNPEFNTWHEYYRENKVNNILSGINQLVKDGKFNNKKYYSLCQATEIFDKYYEEPEKPVLIHGDLNIMNIMANPHNIELTGFIDPCGSMWADREYDLFQLKNMWGNKFFLYETYKEMCGGLSKISDFRVAYYGVMNEVACRLTGGPIFPLWEDLWFKRLHSQKIL